MFKKIEEISNIVPKEKTLSEVECSIFYSAWYYSAIRLASSISNLNNAENISKHLNLPLSLTVDVIDFLIKQGLCIEKEGKLQLGPQSSHLPASSRFISWHHSNWRLKSIEKNKFLNKEELMFTAPMSISKEPFFKIKKDLLKLIDNVYVEVKKSSSEELCCLNIDWFKIK